MQPSEPTSSLKRVRETIRVHHPVRNLFLIDVLQDRESRPVLTWAVGTLLLGVIAYHWLEGWSYLDALYFSVVSLATIGYGDFAPVTELGRAFTIIYVINGIVILLAFFDRIRTVRTSHIGVDTKADKQQ